MSRFLILAGKGKRCSLDLKAISCSSFWVFFFFLFKIGTAGVGLCFSNFRYICNTIFSVSYLFLLFIGLFSKTCKCDIFDGCLQMEVACLSVEGYWSLSLGRQFWGMLFPPLGTVALAVF